MKNGDNSNPNKRDATAHRSFNQIKVRPQQEAAYNNSPHQVHDRDERNKARRRYEAKHGDLPTTTEVDHIKSLKRGGSNDPSNTQAISRHANRSKQEGGNLSGKKR
jgi:hypothetical protein